MKSIAKYILAAVAVITATSAEAQMTRSGYFVEDYTYRFQMNPAYGNTKNFISIPAYGNFNIGINGNLNLTDLIYNVNGQTTTFMNPGVDAAEFLGNLDDINKLQTNFKLDILSAGFKAFGGYNTININARFNIGLNLPKSIFSLLKEGIANQSYQIGYLRARSTSYAEIDLGHSRDLSKEWRVGATVKFLVGAGNFDANMRNANLTLGKDAWSITTDAEINANITGLAFEQDVNETTGHKYVSGAEIDGAGIGGYGVGLDLGVVYKPEALKDWTFSVALLDLGFINWSNNVLASTNGEKSFTTDKYTFNVEEDAENSFDNELDKMKDDLSALYELEDMGDQGSTSKSLATTFNIGAEYTFPLYRKLTFGLLNTTHMDGDFSYTDFRLSANVAPVKFFDASINYGIGTFGSSFGWLANIRVNHGNLFLGMDYTLGKMAKQFVPLNSNVSLNLGVNFIF